MKARLIGSNSLNSMAGRTVRSAVDIAKGRWPLEAWAGEPDKKLERGLEHTQAERGMGTTRELLVS